MIEYITEVVTIGRMDFFEDAMLCSQYKKGSGEKKK